MPTATDRKLYISQQGLVVFPTMSVSSASIEVLEYLLTVRAAHRCRALPDIDHLEVKMGGLQDEARQCLTSSVIFSAQGIWTTDVSCKDVTESCPSLATLFPENRRTPRDEVDGGLISIRYVAVNQSKEESFIAMVTDDGCLKFTQEAKAPVAGNTEPRVCLTFECTDMSSQLRKCSTDVRNFMYKYKLVHPSMAFGFSSSFDDCADLIFGQDFDSIKISKGIKMITDINYFLKPDRVASAPCHHRIVPVSEGSFAFLCPPPSLGATESPPLLSLRCVAVAALIPPPGPPLGASQARPCSCCCCTHLWLSVYGPGSFPLGHPAWDSLETQLNPQHLANWQDFGLTLANDDPGAEPDVHKQPIRDDFTPDLRASFSGAGMPGKTPCLIHLMLFFKENFKGSGRTSVQVRQDLLDRVRRQFPHICSQQLTQIRQIVHDTLARLLGPPQPARKDRRTVMKSAIPACVSALCNIISRSTNDGFRNRCLNAMQVSNKRELSERLTEQLKAISDNPYGQHCISNQQSVLARQHQFPDGVDDEDGGRRASDGTNLGAISAQLAPLHQPTTQDMVGQEHREEDADFDVLDGTRVSCDGSPPRVRQEQVHQSTFEPTFKKPALSSSPNVLPWSSRAPAPVPAPSSVVSSSPSSSSSFYSASAVVPHHSVTSSRATPLYSSTTTTSPPPTSSLPPPERCPSHQSLSHSSRQYGCKRSSEMCVAEEAKSNRPTAQGDARPARDHDGCGGDADDVQLMQETLSGELGNNWFESLMDPADWLAD